MKPFFTPAGRRALASLTRTNSLLAFDFDGTLAPIVPTPSRAYPPAETVTLLRKLCKHTQVAVISGRSLKDLKTRLGFKPHFLIGNHGAEGTPSFEQAAKEARKTTTSWRKQLKTLWAELPAKRGMMVEDKTYSLSLHYRSAPDPLRARKMLIALMDQLEPSPRVVPGKFLFNVTPVGVPHKGTALHSLLQRTRVEKALFIGDDDTDEDVFSLKVRRLLTVRVGFKKASKAQFVVSRQTHVERILADILKFYEA